MKLYEKNNVQVLEDRVGTSRVNLRICVFMVDGLMVDTGPAVRREAFVPVFEQYSPRQVAITHLHEDHAGLAVDIQKKMDIPIYLHHSSVDEAARDARVSFYRRFYWGKRRAFNATPYPATLKTEKYSFEVIETPGHRLDHVMLYEKNEGWLFTGDLFVAPKQKYAFVDDDIALHISSLEKVCKLDFATVFCAHAGVKAEGKKLMESKLNFYYETRERVRKYRALGMGNREIARVMFPRRKFIQYISRGDWSSYNLIKTID